jgi:hypothetical protein
MMRPLPMRQRLPLVALATIGTLLSIAAMVTSSSYAVSQGLRIGGLAAMVVFIVLCLRTWRSW